jgi:peptidoglycan hydrolase-like protein with peptidoglycan-binding domain
MVRRKRLALASLLILASLSSAPAMAKKKHSSHPATKSHHSRHATKKARKAHSRGQQAIDRERATEIQQALIREHYLSGKPSGNWDTATQQAMQRYQQDHGLQAKTVPDARALIGLGLGPSHAHLLNPESAMTTGPEPSHAAEVSQSSARSGSFEPASQTTPSGSPVAVGSSVGSAASDGAAALSPAR